MTAAIIEFLHTPAAFTIIIGIFVVVLNKVFDQRPSWKKHWIQYAPLFETAVRYAEKLIPDDATNKSVRRADAALKYVITLIENAGGAVADTDTQELALNIEDAHHELAAKGALTKP